MTHVIRSACIEDAGAASHLLRHSIRDCCIQDHQNNPDILDAWLKNKTADNLAVWIGSDENYAIVVEHNSQLVGFAMMRNDGYIFLCYLAKEALHAGLGKLMLLNMERKAMQSGLHRLTLNSTRSGYAFYLRNHFKDLGQHRSIFAFESHQMEKILSVSTS